MSYLKIETKQFCIYLCGQLAQYCSPSGKLCCESSPNKCPAQKIKNSNGLKNAHKENPNFNNVQKGLMRGWDKFSEEKIYQIRLSGVPKTKKLRKERAQKNDKSKFINYRHQCQWKFGNDPIIIENIKGYELLKKYGMYNRIKNPTGVVRDHKLSIFDGFKNNINLDIMSHPSNCEFLLHIDNSRKTRLSSINLEKLLENIELWNARLAQR